MRGGLRVPGPSTAKLAGAIENTIGIVGVARCDARSVTAAAITAMTPTSQAGAPVTGDGGASAQLGWLIGGDLPAPAANQLQVAQHNHLTVSVRQSRWTPFRDFSDDDAR
jgi:hypothetical protein